MKHVVAGRVAVGLSAALVGAACGDSQSKPVDSSTHGAAANDQGGVGLARQLASNGDAGLFDRVFVGSAADQTTALVVGVHETAAVAYLCDPLGGARWFVGSFRGNALELSNPDGAALSGVVSNDAVIASLHGTGTHDGMVSLRASCDTSLVRESGTAAGDPVGGLVVNGNVVTGVIQAVPSSAAKSAATTVASATAVAGSVTIGLRVSVGAQIDLSVAVSSPLSAEQRSAILTELENVRKNAQPLLAGKSGDCVKVIDVVAALVLVVVAVVVAALTFGAGSALVAAAVLAVVAIIGAALNDAGLRPFDVTKDQMIARTAESARARIAGTASTTTTGRATTTTPPQRALPTLGAVELTQLR